MDSSDSTRRKTDTEPPPELARQFFPDFETIRLALESGKIGVWSWDIASNALTWSSNLEAIHGLDVGNFDGTFAFFERDIHPDDQAGVLSAIREAMRTQKSYRVRYRLPKPIEGQERWIEATGTVIANDGASRRMVGLCQDVTDRIKLENELRGRAKQQEAVAQLGERALTEQSLERLLNDVASTVAITLGIEFVEILELMPGDTEFLLRAGFGWKAEALSTIRTSTDVKCFAGYALDSAAPIVIDDFKSRGEIRNPLLSPRARLQERHGDDHRGPRWPRLRRIKRLRHRASAIRRAGRFIPGRSRQRRRRRHSAPPARSAP